MSTNTLFQSIPREDHLALFDQKDRRLNSARVAEFLRFNKKDVAFAVNIPVASIRYDEKIPKILEDRLHEWATAINLVSSFFKDPHKTALWFKVPNPQLGNIAPRDLIRIGRAHRLLQFIQDALSENAP